MPTNPRTKLKKTLANSLHNLDKTVYGLITLYDTFGEGHPEFQEYLDVQITALLHVKEMMLDLWARAWGTRPDDYEAWR